MNTTPRAPWARIVWGVYAVAIATLTHWPMLQLPATGLSRSDLMLHIGVFAAWTVLFIRCGWFGPVTSTRNIALGGLCALAYAALDEGTQAIPGVRRFVGWDDFAANMLGVATGVAAVLAACALDPPRPTRR